MNKILSIIAGIFIGLIAYSTPASASVFTLTWLEDDPTLKIEVERSINAAIFSPVAELPAGSLTWDDTYFQAGFTYCYRVRATNDIDHSEYSNVACAVTLGPPPPAPDVLPPVINITSPDTPTVQRHTRVQVDATGTDDEAMGSLQIAVGSSALCTIYGTETTLDASCGWNVPAVKNRTYVITVTATDRAGNVAKSARSVTAR